MESQGLTRLFQTSTSFKIDKKKDRPRWWHTGSGQAKQTPFEVNVSTSIEHYITLGLALPYPFSTKGQVI